MSAPRHRRSPAALREVSRKTDAALQRETARKWAERARACWQKYRETGQIVWRDRALDYRHEAVEHAALVGDGGKLVGEIERALNFGISSGKSA